MIIDFTVTNFRSIRDETTLSLAVESPGSHLQENIAYPVGEKIGVVRTLGIYGANASGKSNLLLALRALSHLVSTSGDLKDGEAIESYQPFRLSRETREAPVRFEVEFVADDGIRYAYRVAFTSNRITEEQLVAYPSRQAALLFSRTENDTWETIKFGATLKGGKRRHPFFANNAYLSKAGNSADAPAAIRNSFDYLRQQFVYIVERARFRLENWHENPRYMKLLSTLLSATDTGIEAIGARETEAREISFPEGMPEWMRKDYESLLRYPKQWQVLFSHRADDGQLEEFELKDESAGTQRLHALAPAVFAALNLGGVVLLDELESGMHPFMAELIVKLFNDSRVNTKNAQLIFTTHNVHVMSSEHLRRDQIWFAEKQNGASRFYALSDFDKNIVKPTSPFHKWYLEGRFDAVPKIDYQTIVNALIAARSSDAKETE
ncbi:MAG: ATP-binding protein [Myxococcota bacterium]|jgi:hypothetical protein|nr:ATP-binding protein [Myxococcota bacterium]